MVVVGTAYSIAIASGVLSVGRSNVRAVLEAGRS